MAAAKPEAARTPMRPPAVPLVTTDPYFSVWSMADCLTDDLTRHWTGKVQSMFGMARIDGKVFRFLGVYHDFPAMDQVGLEVLPTRTIARFEAGGIALEIVFLTPLLPHDLDVLARPATYIVWTARSADGKSHNVSLYFDVSAGLAVNSWEQKVVCGRFRLGGTAVLTAASEEQDVLGRSGDDLRIDWGTLYLVRPEGPGAEAVALDQDSRGSFIARGSPGERDEMSFPRPVADGWPVLASVTDLGAVGGEAVTRHVLLAYDDRFSVEFLDRRLRPYWRRNGAGPAELIEVAERELPALLARCAAYDAEIMADLAAVGGEGYARMAALAFRQCVAAHKLAVEPDGQPVFFSKENFSNGCIDTVDVTYPSSPFFLLLAPDLLRAQLRPILDYASLPRWRFPFAPHDLGTYPLANGQVYGGGERTEEDQMPIEECGNMLLMIAALAKADGNADFAARYWPVVTAWAAYLREKGMNPENQLCTDDFAGHLAGNTNLSIKAILAIAGYARLCERLGKTKEAAEFGRAAREMAAQWVREADDGDHYRLAFDRPGTWSQKYNLVWDGLLGLGVFPAEVAKREIAYYKTRRQAFGLPLDNRKDYTKLDWVLWTATMAADRKDFDALVELSCRWVSETPTRVPLTDWYWTTDGRQAGFQARSVVGGVYIPMLRDEGVWAKWRGRSGA
jgi:hypothetical protein